MRGSGNAVFQVDQAVTHLNLPTHKARVTDSIGPLCFPIEQHALSASIQPLEPDCWV